MPVPLLDGEAKNWGRQLGKNKKSSSLPWKTWDLPLVPGPCWHGCASLSRILQTSRGEPVCRAPASLALCAAGLRSVAGPRTGLGRSGRVSSPASILAHSGCETAPECLSKTSGTAACPGCKSSEVTVTEPPSALHTAVPGAPGLLSLICQSPGWFSWPSQLSPGCKSLAPQGHLLPAPQQHWGGPTMGVRSGVGWWEGSGSTDRLREGAGTLQPTRSTLGVHSEGWGFPGSRGAVQVTLKGCTTTE